MASITMRIDEDVKIKSQNLLSELGMDVTTYLTLALKQLIREQALPFQPSVASKNNQTDRKEAYLRLEQLRVKGTVTDYDAELASYRDEKYGI
jgi:addiction module RelB/DinJ family antitoxin